MRRYYGLGFLRKTRRTRNATNLRSQRGSERFVSESAIKDLILYRRLARSHPGLRSLQYASDDVDWKLEYFCDILGAWVMRILDWILWFLQTVANCFLPQQLKRKAEVSEDIPEKKDTESKDGDDEDTRCVKRFSQMHYDVTGRRQWKYDRCRPFQSRRIIKRKWFLKSETKKWANDTLALYQRHVNRGFRTLCSKVGKDTKICVIDHSSPPGLRNSYVFFGDERTLSTQSDLFRTWFKHSGGRSAIETSFVTPEEMEAILVYIYSLTWPLSMMVGHVKCGKRKCKRRALDRRFLDVLELYGMSLKLSRENPFHVSGSELSPLQLLATYATSEEEILYDSFFHPNLQYIFGPTDEGFQGQGDCHFVSEVNQVRRRSQQKSMNKTLDEKETIVQHVSPEAEDNSNVKRSFLRLPNPFLRRVHPEPTPVVSRSEGTGTLSTPIPKYLTLGRGSRSK